MRAQPPKRMTAEEFVEWAMRRPEGERYELVAGEVIAMAPERVQHIRAKTAAWRLLSDAVARADLACEALGDGASLRIDDHTVYEPDALIRCGEPIDPDAVVVADPLVVVEVLSPTSDRRDGQEKLEDYFRLPSVRHYLVVNPLKRSVVHHARGDDETIVTRIHRDGELQLDPPGLTVELAALFR
jgi:Uma2 family endonuclease